MNISSDALLDELKHLNDDLKTTLKNEKANTLTTTVSSIPSLSATQPFILTEDNLSAFILANSQKIVEHSLEAIAEIKTTIANTLDGDIMSGYANIVKATTSAIDTLNNIQLEKGKQKAAKELKTMDIESKKLLKSPEKTGRDHLLIATREDIVKMLEDTGKNETQTVINVPSKELPTNN